MEPSLVLSLHQLATTQPWFAGIVAVVAQDGIFVLPIALVVVWLVARAPNDRQREAVIAGVAAAAVAFGIGLLLERTLNRPRPFVELGFEPLFPHAADSSFPSDHTLVGVALVAPLLWRGPKLGVWLLAWAVIVGFARVAAGLHYPTDILGSVILGLGIAALVWVATQPVLRRLNLQRWDGAWLRSPPEARRR